VRSGSTPTELPESVVLDPELRCACKGLFKFNALTGVSVLRLFADDVFAANIRKFRRDDMPVAGQFREHNSPWSKKCGESCFLRFFSMVNIENLLDPGYLRPKIFGNAIFFAVLKALISIDILRKANKNNFIITKFLMFCSRILEYLFYLCDVF
jgi:hypothetical protein